MILWTGAGYSHYRQQAKDTPASLRPLTHTSSSCPARMVPEQYPRTLLTYPHSSLSQLAIGSLRAGQPRTLWTASLPTPGLDIPPGLHPLQLQLFLQGGPGKECSRTSEPCTFQLQLSHQGRLTQHRMFRNPGPISNPAPAIPPGQPQWSLP